ncbi:MAG: glycosyltransferase family 4 protein [Erysipelotrichaceae bacterium]|nr:glycosyltransferase family 4 protein [Erysipelotrichaceae bacterium]
MKILWLVNIIMPELAVHLEKKPTVFGGWISGAMKAVKENGYELVICTTASDVNETQKYIVNDVTYYISKRSAVAEMEEVFKGILNNENPDVVHIYGTEFEHSWAMAKCSDVNKTVVTIQGAMTYLKDHVYAGLEEKYCKDNLLHKTLRLIHKGGTSIELQKKSFEQRAEIEQKVLKHVKYVMGGSKWGNAVAWSINPHCTTFDSGLILRDSFYTEDRWSYENCEPHSIYILHSYPIKGFHKFLDALPLVVNEFPDTKVFVVANTLPVRNYTHIKKMVLDAAPDYNWIIQNKIEQLNLSEHIKFLGYLNEQQVKERMLKSNVFVSASSLENQSTTLGEAMILGVPSIASFVGAMPEMIEHGKDGFLYPFNEPYIMAHYICKLFKDSELAEQYSVLGHKHAEKTYDKEKNKQQLIKMYQCIAKAKRLDNV